MRRKEKAARIGAILDQLYPLPSVPLRHADPFTLLVSVVLSAQSTDKKVNQVTPALFTRAGTPEEMARLSPQEIEELIHEIGLAPTKARRIQALSEQLVGKHGGQVPADFAALEALPGVGHKSASVVVSQGFGVPAFPVDTHIHRLAARWGLSDGSSVVRTERDLKALFPPDEWNRRHLQIIYFGREHCPARNHEAHRCPICSWASPRRKARAPARRSTRRAPRRSR